MKTVALPTLTYGTEVLNLNKSELKSLDFCLNRALFKIFGINDCINREHCMLMFDILTVPQIYAKRNIAFKNKIKLSKNVILSNLNTV